MLPEWYFCCCVDATPGNANTFLCTLETFDSPESNDRLLYMAFDELKRMDVWMRIYALPRVLVWRRGREVPANLYRQVGRYLEGLQASIPVDYHRSFAHLIDLLAAPDATQSELIPALEQCAGAVTGRSRKDISTTPYIDLKEFLPETFILAVVAAECAHEKAVAHENASAAGMSRAKAFTAGMDKSLDQNDAMKVIFRGALKQDQLGRPQFGRLAFRLAARIAILVPTGDSKEDLLSRVRRIDGAALEPDLLQTSAEILFLHDLTRSGSPDRTAVCEDIHRETLALAQLRRWFRKSKSTQPIARLNFGVNEYRPSSLPIVYWQAILWDLSLRIDPEATAPRLAAAWQPRGEAPAEAFSVKGPFAGEAKTTWEQQLGSLLIQLGLGKGEVNASTERELEINPSQECLLLSPWVARLSRPQWNQRYSRYQNATRKGEVLIRLVAAIAIASRLLELLPDGHESRTSFAAMITHGHDVLDMFRFWLRNFDIYDKTKGAFPNEANLSDRDKHSPRLNNTPLTSLTLFGMRQSRLVGTGKLASAPPELFMRMLRAGRPVADTPTAKSVFYDTVLPEVIMAWIADAYNSAAVSGGTRSWVHMIPEAYGYFTNPNVNHSKAEKVEAALVPRFLSPGTPLRLGDGFRWQDAKNKDRPVQWRVGKRLLLLTERDLPPEDWDHPEWDNLDWRGVDESHRASVLVRDLERLAAVLRNPGRIAEDKERAWRVGWMAVLNSVSKKREMDRYIRLRLLELLSDENFEGWEEALQGLELITLVLLEYGSVYDLEKMFDIVFPSREGRLLAGSATRASLQASVLRAVCRDPRRVVETGNDRRGPRDPRETMIEYQRSFKIQGWLERISLMIMSSRGNEPADYLSGVLTKALQYPFEESARSTMHSVKGEIESGEAGERKVTWEHEGVNVPEWSVCAAAYDPNRFVLSLLYKDYDLSGVDDLFSNPELANEYPEKRTRNVLAVLMGLQGPDGGPYRYVFNCGLSSPLVTPEKKDALPFKTGTYVSLPIYRAGSDRFPWRIQVHEGGGLRELPTRVRPGDVAEIALREFNLTKRLDRMLTIRRGKEVPGNKGEKIDIELGMWDTDVSRCFHRFAREYSHTVYARYGEDGKWWPVDRTLADLLLATSKSQKVITLTLIGKGEALFGEPAWRFSVQPGENYLLDESLFEPRDAELIRQQAERKDAYGLLVTVEPSETDARVLLSLVKQLPESWIDPFHKGLQVPFDHRNIKWQKLFSQQESPVADRYEEEPNKWYYELGNDAPAGYPPRVLVEWDRKNSPGDADWNAEFKVARWDDRSQRTAIVEGAYPGQNKIRPVGESVEKFLRWWVTLCQDRSMGEYVTLDYMLKPLDTESGGYYESRGLLLCKTEDNLLVYVEAESLTMRELRPGLYPPGEVKNRLAEITSVRLDKPVKLLLDESEIPHEAIEDDECRGVLLSVPTRGSIRGQRPGSSRVPGKVCKVAWTTRDGRLLNEQDDLLVENFNVLNISQGCLIKGERERGRWKFVAIQPRLTVRALWREGKWEPGHDLTFLDIPYTPAERVPTAIAEVGTGRFAVLGHGLEGARHLAAGDGRRFSGGLKHDAPARNLGPEQFDRPKTTQRVVLEVDRKVLIGECASGVLGRDVAISKVSVKMTDNGDGLFSLRRVFGLRRRYVERTWREEESKQDLIELWKMRLEEYLSRVEDRDLAAVFEPRSGTEGVRLFSTDPKRPHKVPPVDHETRWTSWVKLAENEGAFVVGRDYPPDGAVVWLFRTSDGRILASFRRVPHLTPESYHARFGSEFDVEEKLLEALYYVGPEEVHPVTGESYGETRHRFEFGYGHTLLVPEHKLTFQGGAFRHKARLALFHGDAVLSLRFVQDKQQAGAEPGEADAKWSESCVIDILSFRPSLEHSLYSQRADHKIVHILHIRYSKDSVTVKVEGFDDNLLTRGTRSYEPRNARLTEASEDRMLRRLAKAGSDEPRELLILGRLDMNTTMDVSANRFGKDLYFEHVRFSFADSPLGPPLEDGERVFLQAGEIVEERNDTFLYLEPPRYPGRTDFSSEDIGKDFYDRWHGLSRVRLSRRYFSVRESLLRRIKEQDERDGGEPRLKGNFLLVRLSKEKSYVRANLREKAPTRKETALVGKITREGDTLAAVVQATEESIRVEIEPGIFVNLSEGRIESRPERLERGDIIRIQKAEIDQSKFKIMNAAFADARYVPPYTRPAVLLPLNNLWNRDSLSKVVSDMMRGRAGESSEDPATGNGSVNSDIFWRGREVFSIGGLPDIISSAGFYDRGNRVWRGPRAQEVVGLMETPHPKFVRLGHVSDHDHASRFIVAPLPANFPVGSISYRADNLEVEFKPAATSGDNVDAAGRVSPLRWAALSFKDEPILRIIERARNEPWRYHDSQTGTWTREGGIVSQPTGSHDILSGPLFFEESNGELRLRYSQGQFTMYGYPIEELINSLLAKHNANYTYAYTVAGLSDTDIGGLWVELVPGRIVELPSNRVFLRTSAGKEEPLASMSWGNFAPGDSLTLEMNSSDPFKIDRIFLKDWRPGPRRAFGPQRAFLPVSRYDAAEGGLAVGAGSFTLTLPVTRAEASMKNVILGSDNSLEDITGRSGEAWPDPGDSVLLCLDEHGRPVVSGMSDLAVAPDRHNVKSWRDDPLTEWVAASPTNLASLLKVVGGAMPVTVEGVSRQARRLFFSLRDLRLAADIAPGKIALTRLMGLLPDKQMAVLRCGSGLFIARMDQVISGLPEESFEAAAQFLAAAQSHIWMRGNAGAAHGAGLYQEPEKEFYVKVLGAVADEDAKAEPGLICRGTNSQSLYWLAKASVAWTPLTNGQFRRLFPRDLTLRVILSEVGRRTPGISVVALGNVEKEFKEMIIGKELSVRILLGEPPIETGGALQYLAESASANVLLLCESYDRLEEENVRVEVIRRKKDRHKTSPQLSVVVTPFGKKRQSLDVPGWMREQWPQRRDVMSSYRERRTNPRPLSEFSHPQLLKDAEDAVLEQILCYAYHVAEVRPGRLDLTPLGAASLSLATRTATVWLERIKSRPEVYLPYAIIAILLLQKASSLPVAELGRLLGVADTADLERRMVWWRVQAREAVQDLGARALRSMHVEVLALEWIFNPDNRSRDDGLWLRLQKTSKALRDEVDAEDLEAIRQFCYAVGLRDAKEDLKVIADGLISTVGELPTRPNTYLKSQAVRTTGKLIEIYRTLPRSNRPLRLLDSHARDLTDLLDYITSNSLDITLLDPLPPLGPARRG